MFAMDTTTTTRSPLGDTDRKAHELQLKQTLNTCSFEDEDFWATDDYRPEGYDQPEDVNKQFSNGS